MVPNKACPVVLRTRDRVEILAFEHPVDKRQIVKGTIEPGENPESAALRELAEESGIEDASIQADLGLWTPEENGQVWAIYWCSTARALPDQWVHPAKEDGTILDFHFFWYPLEEGGDERWKPVHRKALSEVRRRLAGMVKEAGGSVL